jgi:hypothetical protein
MVDHFSIPHKTNGAALKVDIETVVRQAVQQAVAAALPQSIRAQQVDLTLHITVNVDIHY